MDLLFEWALRPSFMTVPFKHPSIQWGPFAFLSDVFSRGYIEITSS
jgi:hypothetical protein